MRLPADVVLVRTTDEFTEESIPQALLRAHRVAEGAWGRLVVREGAVEFVFEDDPATRTRLGPGASIVIPPGRFHHVEIIGAVKFVVEFYRPGTVGGADAVAR